MLVHTKTIDGITYTTTTLPASKGLVILPKLLAIFGEPVLKLFFASGDGERGVLLQDPKIVATILAQISNNVAETEGLLFIRDLFAQTTADKVRIGEAEVEGEVAVHFDSHFAARYGHLANVAMWVATCNFATP